MIEAGAPYTKRVATLLSMVPWCARPTGGSHGRAKRGPHNAYEGANETKAKAALQDGRGSAAREPASKFRCRQRIARSCGEIGNLSQAPKLQKEGRRGEAPARLVRESGRDGGGEAPAGLCTTEYNTLAFKRC
jgi:hypothetical protein